MTKQDSNRTAGMTGSVAALDYLCWDQAMPLLGKVPRDVWITRLEAELPREAFDSDLALQAALDQSTIEHRLGIACFDTRS